MNGEKAKQLVYCTRRTESSAVRAGLDFGPAQLSVLGSPEIGGLVGREARGVDLEKGVHPAYHVVVSRAESRREPV